MKNNSSQLEKALILLKRVKPYIKQMSDDSESKYDNYEDECYESYYLYDIMKQTRQIINDIDELLGEENE